MDGPQRYNGRMARLNAYPGRHEIVQFCSSLSIAQLRTPFHGCFKIIQPEIKSSYKITFINAQDCLDNLIGQNVITWGCINMAYQNQSSAYVSAVLCDTQRRIKPIRITNIGITRLTHVLWKCFMCPQNVNLPISIWLYST